LVLAANVAADIDSPPHDKSVVDGYAVQSTDMIDGLARLKILEEITAGAIPKKPVAAGYCTRIMTGAPLPEGADAVVMVEKTSTFGDTVEIRDDRFRSGQNILRRGTSFQHSEIVLRAGAELEPAEIGLLAEVGQSRVQTIGPVRVGILSTGNELVDYSEVPGPGNIRNSNGPLLNAACRRAGAIPIDLGIARDDVARLRRSISEGLQCDILVISGGVSAGVLDLVPRVLADIGVRPVFHKVHLKPGKPLWFGVNEQHADSALAASSLSSLSSLAPRPSTLVFGLPGNPVSSLVCFELFVRPAILKMAGRHWESPHATRSAKLTRPFNHRGDRPTYHPAVLIESPDGALVEPTVWKGSADLRGFIGANSLIAFPPGNREFSAGDSVDVLSLHGRPSMQPHVH
jgi:molybdopterin molybdotransferase